MAATLRFKPVTRTTVDDFIAVFSGRGGPKHCWCMVWRMTPDELKDNNGPARKQQMLGRIDAGVTVGLVGYADGEPVAWVSIAPKETFRKLGGPDPEAGQRVWSLTCMYMRTALRRQGLGRELIEAAIKQARKRKATVLEAYPVDPTSPSYRFMGFVPNFEALGFEKVGTAGTRRHVMQLRLTDDARAKS